MPTQLTIPLKTGLVSGRFEAIETHSGLLALRFAWGTSLGPLGSTLDAAFTPIGGGGIGIAPPVAGEGINVFDPAFKGSLSNIGKGLTNTQPAVSQHLITQAQVHDGMSALLEGVAVGVLETKKHVARKTAPKVVKEYIKTPVKVNLKPLQKQITAANGRAINAERENVRLRKRVKKLENTIAQPAPFPWPGIPGEVERIRGEIDRIWGKVRNPAKWIGAAALAALLVKALSKMGANYITCKNNKRWGSHVCRDGENFLSNLIQATALIVFTVSLLEFARTMQFGVGEAISGVKKFWGVSDRVLGSVAASAEQWTEMDWRVS